MLKKCTFGQRLMITVYIVRKCHRFFRVGKMSTQGNGILSGIRVVEFESSLATSIVGLLLAEQGAKVVRIINTDKPTNDQVLEAILGRSKMDVPLSLSKAQHKATLNTLLERCDIALTDGNPVELEINFDELRSEANPGLIDCTIPAFPAGDDREKLPLYDALSGGAAALYEKAFGKPVYHDLPIPSVLGAMFAASATMGALVSRLKTGRGQHVEANRFGAALFSQILMNLIKSGVPRGFMPLKMSATPFMKSWKCLDGRWVYLHITLPAHNALIMESLEKLGHGADVAELGKVLSPATIKDPSQVGSIAEAKAITEIYRRIFAKRTADEWEKLIGQDLCCIKIRTIDEWLKDSLDASMDDACKIDDPALGPLFAPGPGITSPEVPTFVGPRTIGADEIDALLDSWKALSSDLPKDAPAEPVGPPLAGLKVADMSRIIAGPSAARVLAELGADVISIGNPSSLDWALSFHLLFNAGKRSVAIDSTTDEGKAQVQAILEHFKPDVLIQNYRHIEIADQVGIGPQAMREKFPKLVYTHLNAYGDRGEWKDRPGFEQVVQAVTGIQVSYGPPGKPKLLPTPIIDIGSGLAGALAALFGIYNQKRNGKGILIKTHLTWVAVLLQILDVAKIQRAQAFDENAEVIAGISKVKDGHAVIAGPRGDLKKWANELRVDIDLGGHRILDLPKKLKKMSSEDLLQSIAKAGLSQTIGVVLTPKMKDIPKMLATRGVNPVVFKREYDGASKKMIFQPMPFYLSHTPVVAVKPPPVRGTHTQEVLEEAGIIVPKGTGISPYPSNPPLIPWLLAVAQWGWFAYRRGNI
jgi:crotonobetainyl-CoA:carnitine CoA-transferase CaiB-like acyl-CoA transferase